MLLPSWLSHLRSAMARWGNRCVRRRPRSRLRPVLEHLESRVVLASDFGDAPLPYWTTLTENGAEHTATGPILGTARDSESDGVHSSGATADDTTGTDDEDGVTFPAEIRIGELDVEITINVSNAPSGARLDAWIDWNGDGNWGGMSEQVAVSVAVVAGSNTLQVDVPTWTHPGTTFARFRLSTAGGLGIGGAAADGEVEDYAVTLLPPAPGSGVFSAEKTITTDIINPYYLFAADIDGDGDIDLASTSYRQDRVAWHENDGNGNFTLRVISDSINAANSIQVGDVDGDGDMDIVVSGFSSSRLYWFENDGSQNFTTHRISSSQAPNKVSLLVDLDGDGDQDFLTANGNSNKIAWHENDGSENFTGHDIDTSIDVPWSMSAADLDGDGDLDFAVAGIVDDIVCWYENNGSQSFTKHTLSTAEQSYAVLATDLDGDGDMDLVSAAHNDRKLIWYDNNGSGNFVKRILGTPQGKFLSLFAADMDGDGDMDLLTNTGGGVAWMINDGNENFTQKVIGSEILLTFSSPTADIDGDGDLDIFAASYAYSRVVWYENISDSIAPSVTLSSTTTNTTRVSPIPVTVTFSETVTGFTVNDLVVTGGTVSGFSGSGAEYTFQLTPSGQGLVTVDIPAGVAFDVVNNPNTQAVQFTRTFDSVQPGVTLASPTSDPTKDSPLPITITFSEPVTGFTAGDVLVSGGTLSNFSGSGANYSLEVTPSGQGTVSVFVPGDVAFDAAGNGNTLGIPLSRVFDDGAPAVTLSTSALEPTNVSPIPVTVTFTEAVTGFIAGDLVVTGGTVTNFAGSGSSYTFDFVPSGQGTITIDLPADRAADAAGNGNTAAAQLTRTYDSVRPTVSLSSLAADPTNVTPIPVTITFSEAVTGLTLSDLTVTGGVAGNLQGSGSTYTFDLTPTVQGTVTVDLLADRAFDAAGNGNTAAAQFSRAFDSVQPTVSITSPVSSPTNVSPIPVTISFSEAVTGFDAGDLIVNGGSVSNFSGSGATYTFDLTPQGQGSVTVDIPAGVAMDSESNLNTQAVQFVRIFDTQPPSVTLNSSAPALTNVSPIPVTVTFSEAVTGFVAGDVTITGGTISGFTGSGANYSFNVIPAGQGQITVDVAGGVATDAAGNTNTSATQLVRAFDNIRPMVLLSTGVGNPTNTTPIPVTITFSESVADFVAGDLLVSGATISNFAGSGTSYTLDLVPTGQGSITLDLAANQASDASGNGNKASNQLALVFDSVRPSVSFSSTTPNLTNESTFTVAIVFSEPVTGFTVDDLQVAGATLGNFASSGATYSVEVSPTVQGSVTLDLAANLATDAAGNGNTAAARFAREFDDVRPAVSLSSVVPAVTNVSPFTVNISFSEPVTGFALSDLDVFGATAGNFQGSGTDYSVDITPGGNWTVTVLVAGNVASDAAGNGNTASASFTRTFDNTPPTAEFSSPTSAITRESPIPVTLSFSEAVTGLTVDDLVATGGVIGNFSGSGADYTFEITPTGQGTITVVLPANSALDAVGNNNLAAPQFVRVFDTVNPTVTVSSTTAMSTNVNPIPVTIEFSEPVTGFDVADLLVAGGTVGSFSGSGAVYQLELIPPQAGIVTLNIAQGAASDAAGNPSDAAAAFSRIFDSSQPIPTISSIAPNPTATSPIAVTVVFNKAVNGFTADDVVVSGAVLSQFQGSGANYSFELVPGLDGLVTVDIPAGVAVDAIGNSNAAADQLARTYDTQGASVTLSSSTFSLTNQSPIPVTIQFSEPVTGLSTGDFAVTGGFVSNLSGSGANYTLNLFAIGQGQVILELPSGKVIDAAGNANLASAQLVRTYDGLEPTATFASPTSNPTGVSPIPVTVTFSEAVTGFDVTDLVVSGATIGNFTGSGASYAFELTPTAAGLVTVNLAANAAQDAAGNGNTIASPFQRTWDDGPPTVAISSTTANLTNVSPLPVTVTFSEPVTGFTADDVVVAGGTVSNFAGSGAVYTFAIVPAVQGLITVDITADVAQDGAGNLNTEAAQLARTFEDVAPQVALQSLSPNPTGVSPIPVSVIFSEPVLGFTVSDLVATGGSITNFTGSGAVYVFDLVPSGPGTVTVDLAGNVAQDAAGNANAAATQFVRQFDVQPPSVVLTSPVPATTSVSPIPVTVTFSEAVTGFEAADLIVGGGTVSDFNGSGASYTFNLHPAQQGSVSVDLPADIAVDDSGMGNTAAATLTRVFDNVRPTATIQSTAADPTSQAVIPVTVTFSEAVIGFTADDVVVSNGSVSNFAGSGTSYSFDVTASADGVVTVDVPESAGSDAAGNDSLAADTLTRIVDRSPPVVALNGPAAAFKKKQAPVAFAPGFTVEEGHPGGGSLVIAFDVASKKSKVFDSWNTSSLSQLGSVQSQQTGSGMQLTVTLRDDVTAQEIEQAVRALTFSTAKKGLKIASRQFHLRLTDGVGLVSNELQQTIQVFKK